MPRRGIDLIQRAVGEGVDLHRVDKAAACGLHPGGGIGLLDAQRGIGGLNVSVLPAYRHQLTRQR